MKEYDIFSLSFEFKNLIIEPDSAMTPEDFVNEIHFKVHLLDDEANPKTVVAKGSFSQFLFSLSDFEKVDFADVADVSAEALRMAEILFDWSNGTHYMQKIKTYFKREVRMKSNICLLERLEILPEYRGKGLGRMIFYNLVQKFYGTCDTWIVRPFPLQHGVRSETDRKWIAAMQYNLMNPDIEASEKKVFDFFRDLGFENPFEKEYFISTPERILEAIKDLEEFLCYGFQE